MGGTFPPPNVMSDRKVISPVMLASKEKKWKPGDPMYPPKNARCAFLPSSSYQVITTKGYENETQAILDTGSVPTIVRKNILPKGMKLTPIEETYGNMFLDLNGGLLPILGAVILGVKLWVHVSHACLEVDPNMTTPAILGHFFSGNHTPGISTRDQHLELLTGMKVPLNRYRPLETGTVSALCTCLPQEAAKVQVAEKFLVLQGTIANVEVKADHNGHDFVRRKLSHTTTHGIQVAAQGPTILGGCTPKYIQVMHVGTQPLGTRTGMTVGWVEPHDGPTYHISREEMRQIEEEQSEGPKEKPRHVQRLLLELFQPTSEERCTLCSKNTPPYGKATGT